MGPFGHLRNCQPVWDDGLIDYLFLIAKCANPSDYRQFFAEERALPIIERIVLGVSESYRKSNPFTLFKIISVPALCYLLYSLDRGIYEIRGDYPSTRR